MLDYFLDLSNLVVEIPVVVVLAIILSSFHILPPWEEAVVLQLGKFNSIRGNGLFWTIPFVQYIDETVDLRTATESFDAKGTLTKDTVPVTVEAILFYKVVDTKSAVLNVEDYHSTILAAATTALREAISQNDLQTLLTQRQEIDDNIAARIAPKAKEWGIQVASIEIRDIQVPQDLSDAMSRQAQAQREKQARVTLAEAEFAVAQECAKASEVYENNPAALHLRGMNMLYEGLKEKGALIIVPCSAVDSMNLGTLAIAAKNGAPLTP